MHIFLCFTNREENNAEKQLPSAPSLKDEIKRLPVVQVSGKAKGLDLVIGKGNELRVSNGIRQILKILKFALYFILSILLCSYALEFITIRSNYILCIRKRRIPR